jgi:hypothetical protein
MSSPDTSRRQLARDTSTGRVGEVMPHPWGAEKPAVIHLRPVGGGIEWAVRAEHVQLLDNEQQEDR